MYYVYLLKLCLIRQKSTACFSFSGAREEETCTEDRTVLVHILGFLIAFFFFYQGFLSRTLATHRAAGEGRGPSFSTLPLPLAHEHSDIYLQLCT